ncbi:MAG: hypothetical protein ACFB4J_18675 [Elainellaceae cyanobacterium]
MNPDTLTETIQKGFRVTLGAASFLAETLQDAQKRDENLGKLRVENLATLSNEWAVEGAQKEQEARSFMESVIGQSQPNGPSVPTVQTTATGGSTAAGSIPGELQTDLDILKQQLVEIRTELEKANSES